MAYVYIEPPFFSLGVQLYIPLWPFYLLTQKRYYDSGLGHKMHIEYSHKDHQPLPPPAAVSLFLKFLNTGSQAKEYKLQWFYGSVVSETDHLKHRWHVKWLYIWQLSKLKFKHENASYHCSIPFRSISDGENCFLLWTLVIVIGVLQAPFITHNVFSWQEEGQCWRWWGWSSFNPLAF